MTHSDETKAKISVSNAGENHPNFGKTVSNETKIKMSKSHSGKIASDEAKRKISEANKNPSDETRLKMSKSKLGKTRTEETKAKISESKRGKFCVHNISEKINKVISPEELQEYEKNGWVRGRITKV